MDFSSHFHPQYPQPPQPHVPSQSQPHDQSYQPPPQQQPYHSYYQSGYTPTTTYHHPTPNDSTPILPPGVSAAPEPPPQPALSFPPQHQHSYYPQGLNPAAAAAVAALSQLTQFAGSMGAAERARAGLHESHWQGGPMQLHVGPHGVYHPEPSFVSHRGGKVGGRRGRGGLGNLGHPPPRTDGSTSHSQGRGRGKGSKRRVPQHASSQPETLPPSVSEHGNVQVSAGIQGEAPVSASVPQSSIAPGKASSSKKQPQNAWCELCRVACTSLDILEKHKSGKRHKKNLQRSEELQKAGNSTHMPMSVTVTDSHPTDVLHTDSNPIPASVPALATAVTSPVNSAPTTASSLLSEVTTTVMDGVQSQQQSQLISKSEMLAQAEGGEIHNAENTLENKSTAVINDGNKTETEPPINKEGQAKASDGEPTEAQGTKRKLDNFDTQKRGSNRKLRGGRGGKKVRTFDRPTRLTESHKPKELVPIMCDLCNVKCDTAAVFETHLAGKKHQSKLKRFQDHRAMFGSIGLQALYPPNPNTQPIFIPQGHQQTMFHPLVSFHQPVSYLPPAQQSVTFSGPQAQQNPESYLPHGTWDALNNDKPLEFRGQEGTVIGQEGQSTVGKDEPVDAVIGSEPTAPGKDSAVTVADYVGVPTSSENVILP